MNIEKIHPDLRKMVKHIPAIPYHNSMALRVLQFFSKRLPRPSTIPGVSVSEHKLKNASLRIYRPDQEASGAALLWFHGGGFIIGCVSINDQQCCLYAKNLKLVVISVEYRLAPQHPFPCAFNDCFEAWQWVQNSAADLGIAPDRIVISGQSAGGGLAASLVQQIHDLGGIQPAGQALFCAMLDDRTAARRELDDINHRMWNNKNNRGGWARYLGHPPGQVETRPYAVPARREDLSGLPPTWVGVSDIDLFFEENQRYAARLKEAGVNCQLEILHGAPHGFEMQGLPLTREFTASNYRFLRETLQLQQAI